MSNKLMLGFALFICVASFGQEAGDSAASKVLEEVVISFNKWEQKINEIPNKITKITKANILRGNPQTAADLLSQSGAVFVQKSQLGGGSPMIRGFATNRVLLVFDGVRMNNAIYRSGNLQNVISIDPLSIETAEVIFGPGSLIYGSDAIGGVMDFHSLTPKYSNSSKLLIKGSALTRYSSANQENTVHADINVAGKRWSLFSSASFSDFEDLKMGKRGGQDSYLRKEFMSRINNVDSVIVNPNGSIQRFSGYQQVNYLGKLRYKVSETLDLQYAFNYAATSDAARYDRLIQYQNNQLRFAEWNFGPMLWRLHSLSAVHKAKFKFYDEARYLIAYQNYEESRIERSRTDLNRIKQQENVDAISINWDGLKKLKTSELFYGLEHVYNKVGSVGLSTNISTNISNGTVSRYPNGSTWSTTGAYFSYKQNFLTKFTFVTGLRYSYNRLNARFDTTYIKFPYQNANLKEGALTGSAGFVYRPEEGWQLSTNLSTGYRMPNVDDIGKFFESAPGNITVPNPDLASEYAWNFELGISKSIPNKLKLELNGFHTILDNAIVRRPATFNGKDSIVFANTLSKVEALQNVARATVWGIQASGEYYFVPTLSLQVHANWVAGKETDDNKNEKVALRHAPPFYGTAFLRYRNKGLFLEFSANYNASVENKDLAPVEQAKKEIYAKDKNGKPYSPAWTTINIKSSYQLTTNILITAGWENMTNQRYRPYSSGIVAAGSNIILSVRVGF